MDENFVRAEKFLHAIQSRGERACRALIDQDWETYQEAMKWKGAAFHHFMAIDHIIRSQYPDYLSEERWQSLWHDVQASEKALIQQIEIYQTHLNQTLMKIRKSRKAVGRYRSGHKEDSGFIDGV